MQTAKDLEEVNEEFNNFMHKVNEVNGIVKKLASDDKTLQNIGVHQADLYLKENNLSSNVDEEDIQLRVKTDKSVINWKALKKSEDPNTMSQEAFMEEVSKDADRRYRDRKMRKEKSDTLKNRGVKAFKRGEYEKALSCYNKAIDYTRDSVQLYLDRCVIELKLNLNEKAVEDATMALKLNEKSFKGHLLLAKSYYRLCDNELFQKTIENTKKTFPERCTAIEEFACDLRNKKEAMKDDQQI